MFRRSPMPQRGITHIFTLFFVVALISANIASAQSSRAPDILTVSDSHTWHYAQVLGGSKRKLYVITIDQANRRHTCRVQSFTDDKLVCARAIGTPRTYRSNQIVAILLPGDDALRFRVLLGLKAGLGGAIWETVVLAATCPACAVGMGIAAFVFFAAAGAIGFTDDVPDRLLYLAPGQQLSRKLGYV